MGVRHARCSTKHRTIHLSRRERKRSTTKVSTLAGLPRLLSCGYGVAETHTLQIFLSSPHLSA